MNTNQANLALADLDPAQRAIYERLAFGRLDRVECTHDRQLDGEEFCATCAANAQVLAADVRSRAMSGLGISERAVVAKLATALDQLGGRIYRDLAGDYAEIHTSGDVPKTVDGFNAFAEDCLAVLNDPEVRSVVEAALSLPASKETR